jgi:hypothetical protein
MLVFRTKLTGLDDRLVGTVPQSHLELHLAVHSGQELTLKVI